MSKRNAYRASAGDWYERQYQESLKRMDVDAARKENTARVHRKRAEDAAVVDPVESGEVEYESSVDTEFKFGGVPFRVSDNA